MNGTGLKSLCKGKRFFFLNTSYILEHSCWKLVKTVRTMWYWLVELDCCVQDFWADLKHGLVTCWSHGPPTLYKPHEPTHKWQHLPLLSPYLTVNNKCTKSKISVQISPAVHFSSPQLQQPDTEEKKNCPVTILWLWTCPIKLLDEMSMFEVIFRS